MKFLVFLVMIVNLFGYELYVTKKSDLLIVNNLGIECQPTSKGYLCEKSDDLSKVLKFKNYLLNFGVKSYILDEKTIQTPLKTGYCIQLASSKKLGFLKKEFLKVKKYPFSRVEKIGNFYVLRIGESDDKSVLKEYLKKLKPLYKGAFVRKCDYIPSRIVYPFVAKKNKKKKINLKKYSAKELNQLMYKAYLSGNYELAKKISKNLKKTLYRKDALIIDALVLYKNGNLRRACKILEDLNDIYDDYLIQKHMKKVCYRFYLKNAEQQIYISPIRALFNIKKAISLSDDIRAKKDLALIYFNIKEYNSAFNVLKEIRNKTDDKNIANIYANTLFSLNKFQELDHFCQKRDISFCNSYKEYKKAKFLYNQLQYDKAYIIAKKLHKLYPYSKNIKILLAKILNKKHRPDEAMLVIETIFDAKEDVAVISLLRDIFYNQDDIENAYKYALLLKEKGIGSKTNNSIIHEYFLYKAYKSMQNGNYQQALEYTKNAEKYMDDAGVLEMRAEIYYKMKDYQKALKLYQKLYAYEPDERVKKKLIEVYFALSYLDRAKEMALNSDKSVKDFYFIKYAQYLLQKGKYVKANITLKDVNNKSTKNYLKLRGITCYYLNRYRCAVKTLKKSGFDNDINYYLIMSYLNLGDKQKAKELLKNFKNVNKTMARKISNIYIRLGEIKKAKEILNNL